MPEIIKFVQIGLGQMGEKICKLACQKKGIEIVGALEKVNLGRDVGEVIGLGKRLNVELTNNLEAVLAMKADIAVVSTLSSLEKIKDQLIRIIKAGVNVVSTCEELAYPWDTKTAIAEELHDVAERNNVTLLGTGVNPGFCMDVFPIVMTGVCQDVEHIKVDRIQDARSRRLPFQKKIGAGLTLAEFEELKEVGILRHVGLRESTDMVAAAMGWKVDEYSEPIKPIIAKEDVSSEYIKVKVGHAAGVEQIAIGKMKGKEVIRLTFRAYLGANESYDGISIKGKPNMEVIVKDGIQGDIATASMTVNAIPRVISAPPGLLTMLDLPPVHPYEGDWSRLI